MGLFCRSVREGRSGAGGSALAQPVVMQSAGGRGQLAYLVLMRGDVQIGRQFKVVLFGAVRNSTQQPRLNGWQGCPVGNGDTAQVPETPFFCQCHGLTLMLGLFEARQKSLTVVRQLASQRVEVPHAQVNELSGLFRGFPLRVLPPPKSPGTTRQCPPVPGQKPVL